MDASWKKNNLLAVVTLLLNSEIHVRPRATVNFPRVPTHFAEEKMMVVNFETQQQLFEFSVGGFPKNL